jgi:hypothetical protein
MTSVKFQKTVLAVSATAAMAGMLVGGQAFAQVNTEKGSIDVAVKLINSTCVLNLDSTASTTATAAKKALDLGSFSLSNVSSTAATFPVGKGVSVVLSLKESTGTAGCAAISTGKWDVSIDLPASAISTTNLSSNHTLNNTTTGATAATGFAARLTRATNSGASSEALIGNKVPGFGYLLSGSTTGPNLNPTDTVTVTAELYRLTSGPAPAVGIYTASVPLTVVYK